MSPRFCQFLLLLVVVPVTGCHAARVEAPGKDDDLTPHVGDGYRGIWFMDSPSGDQYRYKYSGGFATYPQQHAPIAIHVAAQAKTFFVFGGSAGTVSEKDDELQHMVSYFDHATGTVPRPVRLLQKRTQDAHDNPTLSIDHAGHLYVFSSAHGTWRPAYLHRSKRPYDISEWEQLETPNFSYPQPWYLPQSKRFLFLHTRYNDQRERSLFMKLSADGRTWTEPRQLAHLELGDYQVSWRDAETDRVGTAFDLHPSHGRDGTGLNYRTNLYYAETSDAGATWINARGQPLTLPLTDAQNSALVRDYRAENLNVYLKDIAFTAERQPVILYLTSRGFAPGPKSGPYQWQTARWTGAVWEFRPFTQSDHNYDHGSLYIESDGTWRVIAPTAPGPQPDATGGEMEMWVSLDQGARWTMTKSLTHDSRYNHTYARKPVNAHADFYCLWADGSAFEPSPSSLLFATRDGRVFRLPARMTTAEARPEHVP